MSESGAGVSGPPGVQAEFIFALRSQLPVFCKENEPLPPGAVHFNKTHFKQGEMRTGFFATAPPP